MILGSRAARRPATSVIQPVRGRMGTTVESGIALPDAFHSALQVRLDEGTQSAVQDLGRVPGLVTGAVILHHLVRMQDVGPDLAAPFDGFLFPGSLLLHASPLLERLLVEPRAKPASPSRDCAPGSSRSGRSPRSRSASA